ncbi:Dor1-domain-containing protein [Lactarius indigo]|nr:Dor1-domain-containing protein [Lactarius indigo]
MEGRHTSRGQAKFAVAELSSSKATAYLEDIITPPLDSILTEPANLSSTLSQLINALTNLCTSSYPTFLSLHSTTTNFTATFSSFSGIHTTLLDDIPALECTACSVSSDISSIQSSRRHILELPVLVDACVRAGHFQEALDLAAHATCLAAHFPYVQAVQDVHTEADNSIRLLFTQSLATPRAQGKLPALFPDAWHEGVHDLVTQCAAIFLERPPADLAREDLDSGAPTHTALLTQLTYCGTSFARLGLDFRTLLPPLFDDSVRVRVSGEFSKAAVEFKKTPGTSWAEVGAPRRDSRATAGTTAGVLQMPPQALVAYLPVAVFANALLATLNDLRLLALVALLKDLVRALGGALAQACRTLVEA